MKISWIGHACFLLEGSQTSVLTDPFDKSVPYPHFPEGPVHAVTVSHGHFDHAAVDRVAGTPVVVTEPGKTTAHGIEFLGVPSYHDDAQGADRGSNLMFAFELDGIRIAHLGDLGTELSPEQIDLLSGVEVLLAPVGGHYTIGPEQAKAVAVSLPSLRLLIPMHFRTDVISDWPIAPVEDFVRTMDNVHQIGTSAVSLNRETLPERLEVWILNYA